MAHVLVVDDDPLFREIASEILIRAGHTVSEAENGIHAQAVAQRPDLAVVDMLMPERDGIETIADLRARWPEVKLIAVSSGHRGLGPDLLLRTARAMGADATLAKPVQPQALERLVSRLLD
ncbi:MAG TPA: response regulator [Caulobacteraceae bacterium]|jgi:CheY-like chemotaxis protein|nr:response regulator [Caulobacteraceae bacterium]